MQARLSFVSLHLRLPFPLASFYILVLPPWLAPYYFYEFNRAFRLIWLLFELFCSFLPMLLVMLTASCVTADMIILAIWFSKHVSASEDSTPLLPQTTSLSIQLWQKESELEARTQH